MSKKKKIKYLTLKQGNFLGSKCCIRHNITCYYYYMLALSKVALSSRRPKYTVNCIALLPTSQRLFCLHLEMCT